MVDYIRGSTISFSIEFKDADGAAANPISADLFVTYFSGTAFATDVLSLTKDVNAWKASWDSIVATIGTVTWHARSNGEPHIAIDGEFGITANRANRLSSFITIPGGGDDDDESITTPLALASETSFAFPLAFSVGSGSSWLLSGGTWHDTGSWDDTAVWED